MARLFITVFVGVSALLALTGPAFAIGSWR